jgi:signal transduction histidine kinase
VGFDPVAARGDGFGLGNMRARTGRMGGSLRIESRPGAGTRVCATVPTPPASAP